MAKIIATFQIDNQSMLDQFNNELRENTNYNPNEINKDLLYKKVAIVGAALYDSGAVSITRSQSFFENAIDECPVGSLKEFVQAYIDVHHTTEEAKIRSEEDQALYNRWGYSKSTCKTNGFLFEWDEFQKFRDWYMDSLDALNSVEGNNFTVADTCVMSKHSVTGLYNKTAENCIVVPKSLNMVINQHQRMNKMSILNGLKKAVEKTNGYKPILNFIQDVIDIYYPANSELLSEYMTHDQQEDDELVDDLDLDELVDDLDLDELVDDLDVHVDETIDEVDEPSQSYDMSKVVHTLKGSKMFIVFELSEDDEEPDTASFEDAVTFEEAVNWIQESGDPDFDYEIRIILPVCQAKKPIRQFDMISLQTL